MCLYIIKDSNKTNLEDYVKIAKKNITVYKRLLNSTGEVLCTPYQYATVIRNGDILTAEKFGIKKRSGHSYYFAEVHQGIHAYTKLSTANFYCSYAQIVVECFIPAGTPYIISGEEIVSLQLVVLPIN
jgi:hypothetical protein